jgi:hypothetical protein
MLFDEASAVKAYERENLVSNDLLMHPIVVSTISDEKLQ